jgi:hypothetical protein
METFASLVCPIMDSILSFAMTVKATIVIFQLKCAIAMMAGMERIVTLRPTRHRVT